ncbi:prepilin-type N-terminal cleavage/methylation domain-containing protein [Marinobacter sp. Arc7-DN-1]|nr:prepilin-type N-terminal cleavage/methylation domain-containing protein [Marinobacter sp. Arc7-DN-1]
MLTMSTAKSPAGFTLPELVITVAVLAIATGFAVQSFGGWIERSNHRTLIEHYHSIFAFARWSAASQRQLITVCPLSSQNKCIDDWQNTISVFVDSDNNKQPDEDTVIREFTPDFGGFRIRSRTAGRGYFQFNPRGMAHGAMGSLILCPSNPASGNMSYMAVNIAGRFRAEHDKDADGMIKLSWGAKVFCPG